MKEMPLSLLIVDEGNMYKQFLPHKINNISSIYHAKSSSEGIHLATILKPDLILINLMLSNIDSLEVCHRITQNKSNPSDIIFFTDTPKNASIHEACKRAGGTDIIFPQSRNHRLSKRIQSILQRKEQSIPASAACQGF